MATELVVVAVAFGLVVAFLFYSVIDAGSDALARAFVRFLSRMKRDGPIEREYARWLVAVLGLLVAAITATALSLA